MLIFSYLLDSYDFLYGYGNPERKNSMPWKWKRRFNGAVRNVKMRQRVDPPVFMLDSSLSLFHMYICTIFHPLSPLLNARFRLGSSSNLCINIHTYISGSTVETVVGCSESLGGGWHNSMFYRKLVEFVGIELIYLYLCL
jgi:hypothetical protein